MGIYLGDTNLVGSSGGGGSTSDFLNYAKTQGIRQSGCITSSTGRTALGPGIIRDVCTPSLSSAGATLYINNIAVSSACYLSRGRYPISITYNKGDCLCVNGCQCVQFYFYERQ